MISNASAGSDISSGRFMTFEAIQAHIPWPCRASATSGSSSAMRNAFGNGTRSRFTRVPSMASTAGSTVIANRRVAATVTTPPMPMLRSAAASNTASDERPMATATPDTSTALPTLPIIRSSAISTE